MSTIGSINVAMEGFGGVFSLVFIASLWMNGQTKEPLERAYIRILMCNTVLLFSDAASWVFKGRLDALSRLVVPVANFCVFSTGYILLAIFTEYLVCFMSERGRTFTRAVPRSMWTFACAAIGLVILSQWNGMYYYIDDRNLYVRGEWFWVSQALGILSMIVNGCLFFPYRKMIQKQEKISIVLYLVLPVAAMVIQTFFYGIALLYLATTISILCAYIGMQIQLSRKYAQKELELEKNRTTLMLSQIQPHFLFNSLSVVKGLCQSDPQQAEIAVDHFSDFLRGNFESLTQFALIPFTQELSHTEHYLELERLRFAERLHIIYDVPVTEFMIPPLSIQPIVENAVRYGISKLEEGGTVTIRTAVKEQAYQITIADDGAGFDTQALPKTDRAHIGISNVRERLQKLCGGGLTIESTPGVGTTAVITIPKELKP